MSADNMHKHFRGVNCRRCGKPVRVPALVVKNESASIAQTNSDDSREYHLISQVFVLRCRSCQKESVYSINQIVDCAFIPTPVLGLAKEAAA
jgi:hypothetical protein